MEDEEEPRQIRIGRLTSVGRVGIEMGTHLSSSTPRQDQFH